MYMYNLIQYHIIGFEIMEEGKQFELAKKKLILTMHMAFKLENTNFYYNIFFFHYYYFLLLHNINRTYLSHYSFSI